jgi:hypothetical protein
MICYIFRSFRRRRSEQRPSCRISCHLFSPYETRCGFFRVQATVAQPFVEHDTKRIHFWQHPQLLSLHILALIISFISSPIHLSICSHSHCSQHQRDKALSRNPSSEPSNKTPPPSLHPRPAYSPAVAGPITSYPAHALWTSSTSQDHIFQLTATIALVLALSLALASQLLQCCLAWPTATNLSISLSLYDGPTYSPQPTKVLRRQQQLQQ